MSPYVQVSLLTIADVWKFDACQGFTHGINVYYMYIILMYIIDNIIGNIGYIHHRAVLLAAVTPILQNPFKLEVPQQSPRQCMQMTCFIAKHEAVNPESLCLPKAHL